MYNEAIRHSNTHTPMRPTKLKNVSTRYWQGTNKQKQTNRDHSDTVGGNVLQSFQKTKPNRNLHSGAVIQEMCKLCLYKNLYRNAYRD